MVVGLGTQDDLPYAERFVEMYDITFPMYWDASFLTWQALGIRGQPAAILFDTQGRAVQRWFGPFDLDEALAAARA
jgi:hypothetical protein